MNNRRRHKQLLAFFLAIMMIALSSFASSNLVLAEEVVSNLALRKPVEATTNAGNYKDPALMTNGDTGSNQNSYWLSGLPGTVVIDLEDVCRLDSAKLYTPSHWGSRTQTIKIEYRSSTEEAWVTAADTTAYEFSPSATANLGSVKGRYVRFTITANTGANEAQLSEIEIFGVLAVPSSVTAQEITTLPSANAGGSVNLTAEGTADWAYFRTTGSNYDVKSGVGRMIQNVAHTGVPGTGPIATDNASVIPRIYFSDGVSPVAFDTAVDGWNCGVKCREIGNGTSFSLPGSAAQRTVNVYAAAFQVEYKAEVFLNGGTEPVVSKTFKNFDATVMTKFSFSYQTAETDSLTVKLSILATNHGSTCIVPHAISISGQPLPAQPPANEVEIGEDAITVPLDGGAKLKMQVYADDIIRARYSPNGVFADKDFSVDATENTFVDPDSNLEPKKINAALSNGVVTIQTAKLDVKVNTADGSLSYYDKSGKLILAEKGRSYNPVVLNGQTVYSVTQRFNSIASERLYGFGNINGVVGIKGTNVTISQGNTNKRTPMFASNLGYGILFDITSTGTLNWSDSNSTYAYTGNAADSMDYYFFYGPEVDNVIAGYRDVTGQATMLPKNAFGYTQSRNRYSSQTELVSIVNQFRQKQIPLDTIVIDYHWWKGNGGGYFNDIMEPGSNWNNFAGTMNTLHNNNVTASISVWPTFTQNSDTRKYLDTNYPGMVLNADTNSTFGQIYDPSSDTFRKVYWGLINNTLFSKGMDSIWLDACEPEQGAWPSASGNLRIAFGNSRVLGIAYPLLTNKALYGGQRSEPGNTKRVNTLSRGAVAGIQRYGIQSWSGDINVGFDSLKREIQGVLNFSAAGLPYFSTDTGGYFGFDTSTAANREMFLRWLQFSTFNSIMRVHGRDSIREPWSFGAEYEKYITDYINLRERLLPYTYSLAGKVTQEGYSMVRPLVFDFREDNTAVNVNDQFMFGPSFLVNPVYTADQRERPVYVPAGKWTDFWTGESIESAGGNYTLSAPLDQIPLLVKAGSVVPMGPFVQYADESSDPLELRVYMGDDGTFTLYEDEGNNYNYEQGKFSKIPFSYDEATKSLTIGKRSGSFNGMLQNRTFNIAFVQPGYAAGIDLSLKYQTSVAYDGSEVTVAFDPSFVPPRLPIDENLLPKPEAAPETNRVEKSMVVELMFDEGEGLNLSDTSGNFNNAALISKDTNVWSTGKYGHALHFTGNSDGTTNREANTFAQITNSDSLQIKNEISFASWIYPENGNANHKFILNKGGNDTGYPGFSCLLRSNRVLQVELAPASGSKVSLQTSATVPYDQWTHVAFTWKGTAAGGDGRLRIYINGVESAVSGVFNGPIGVNGWPINVGANSTSNSTSILPFYGYLDCFRLWNYALPAEDITFLAGGSDAPSAKDPTDITASPADRAINLTWTDPSEPLIDHIQVACVPAEGGTPVSFEVPAGTEKLTIPNLKNGAYYQILLQTVLSNGKLSYGRYIVGTPNISTSTLTCVVTDDETVYGYLVNNGSESLSGTLRIEVFAPSGDIVNTVELKNFSVGALDTARIKLEIGAFASNQCVRISYIGADGKELAQPMTAIRHRYYEKVSRLEGFKMTNGVITTVYVTFVEERAANLMMATYDAKERLTSIKPFALGEPVWYAAFDVSLPVSTAGSGKAFIWDNAYVPMVDAVGFSGALLK